MGGNSAIAPESLCGVSFRASDAAVLILRSKNWNESLTETLPTLYVDLVRYKSTLMSLSLGSAIRTPNTRSVFVSTPQPLS